MRYPFLFILTLCFCFSSQASTIIDLKIINGSNKRVQFFTPSEGKFYKASQKEESTNKEGELQLVLDINEPGLVYLFPQFEFIDDHWNGIAIYVEVDVHVKVELHEMDRQNPIKFEGAFSVLNAKLNSFHRQFYLGYDKIDGPIKFNPKHSSQQHWDVIDSLRRKELAEIKSIPSITPKAYQVVEGDINSFHLEMFMALILAYGHTPIDDLWFIKETWIETITRNNIIDYVQENTLSSFWSPSNLNLKRDYLFQIGQEEFIAQMNGEKNGQSLWKILSQIFTDEELESYMAHQLYTDMSRNNFEETNISFYQQFKTQFPNHPFLSIIAPKFEKQLAYLTTTNDDIKFSKDSLATLAKLTKKLNTDYVLISLWKTRCNACMDEWKHIDSLEAFIKEHNEKIALVYLSYDDKRSVPELEKIVNYYKLDGIHFLASEALKTELSEKISGTSGLMLLPTFAIMDKDGNIIKKKTSLPSQWQELQKELLEIINH